MAEYDHALIEYVRRLDAAGLQHNFSVSGMGGCEDEKRFNFFLGGRHIGYAVLDTDHDAGLVRWVYFYPHSMKQGLGRKGIGTLAHVAALQALIDEERLMPGYIVLHTSATRNRRSHMEAMGLNVAESLGNYMGKSVAYANRRGFNFDNPFS